MGGIQRIADRLEKDRQNRAGFAPSVELILKDGDQAFVKFVPSGSDDSPLLDDVYVHSTKRTSATGKAYWTNSLCKRATSEDSSAECKECDNKQKASHRFGIWSYVYYVVHPKGCGHEKKESWSSSALPSGVTVFKEEVNDFKLFTRGLGFNESLWNMILDVYNEVGGLDKQVVRIKRVGSTMTDTTFSVVATGKAAAKLPTDAENRVKDLTPVREYYAKPENEPKVAVNLSVSTDVFDFNDSESGVDPLKLNEVETEENDDENLF